MSTVLLNLCYTAAPDKKETSRSVVKQRTKIWTESTSGRSREKFKGIYLPVMTICHILLTTSVTAIWQARAQACQKDCSKFNLKGIITHFGKYKYSISHMRR